VDAQIDQVQSQISDLNQVLAGIPPTSPEAKDATDQRAALQTRVETLQQQLASLGTLDTSAGTVIGRPDVPTAPVKPNKKVDLAAGLFLGLLIGAGIAIARERRSDRMEDHHDLERVLGHPVLAVVPRERDWKDPLRAELVIRSRPQSSTAEAYRALRTSLLAAADREGIKTVLVTSASEGEGKSTTAANLAVALVEAGRRVVLISADLRRPRIHSFFVIPNTRGLADVLAGTVHPEQSVYFPLPSLMVMPSGPPPTHPADLLESDTMYELLSERPEGTDFIIIDSPPVLPVADGLALASAVDAVLLVADARTTTSASILEAQTRIERVGGRILGAVWNNAERQPGYRGYEPDLEFSGRPRPVVDDTAIRRLPAPAWPPDAAVRQASGAGQQG
jgi:capsular exopolysaccharide synthesis family protein